MSEETGLPEAFSAATAWQVRDDLGTLMHLVILGPPGRFYADGRD